MSAILITLPCTARELESALHAVCDHHGLWNGRIDTMCDGSDSGDACVSIVLSEGSGETSPSPSTPTCPAPTNNAAIRILAQIGNAIQKKMADSPTRVTEHEYAIMNLCLRMFAGKIPAPQIGNAAVMREAMIIAKKAICHHAEHICQSLSWENSNIQSNCADVLCAHRDLCEAKTAINAALAKPPRNCDLYGGDYKMLHTAWFDWTGSPFGQNPDGTVKLTFAEWLLAPAIKKGGAQ